MENFVSYGQFNVVQQFYSINLNAQLVNGMTHFDLAVHLEKIVLLYDTLGRT